MLELPVVQLGIVLPRRGLLKLRYGDWVVEQQRKVHHCGVGWYRYRVHRKAWRRVLNRLRLLAVLGFVLRVCAFALLLALSSALTYGSLVLLFLR